MKNINIDPEYIQGIDSFKWHDHVSMDGNLIIYENITFKDEVIESANNYLTYGGKLFQYNNNIPNVSAGKAIQRNNILFKNCTFNLLKIQGISKESKKN